MSRIGVMHLTDSLDAGGAERTAVNIVNHLPRERYVPYICTTRRDGPLGDLVACDVGRLRLRRTRRFDAGALLRLVAFIRAHDLHILHAHGTSLFSAVIASLFPPYPVVVWHDHLGRYACDDRPIFLYRLFTRRVSGVIVVNQPMAEWSRRRLRVPADRVWYVPNFVCPFDPGAQPPALPGVAGSRIVCVANLRPQKDHLTLVRAMALVVRQAPTAHLVLVGVPSEQTCLDLVRQEISKHEIDRNVSLLGRRMDVPAVLKGCDIGVLSSATEGFPFALIEYGMAGLPSVATRVGQCEEVLDHGRVGVLVPPRSPDQLAEVLLQLIQSPARRAALGERFQRRVQENYSPDPIMAQICAVYGVVLHAEQSGK
jgi:glycosyltransferase involved in cell wall biosynthesis